MSTSSLIGIKLPDNKGKFVYCHWDGYPDGVGKILRETPEYNTKEGLERLLSFGDISSLGSKIDPNPDEPHDLLNRQDGVTVFYTRDRGDRFRGPATKSLDSSGDFSYVDYTYMFDPEENEWLMLSNNGEWITMDEFIGRKKRHDDLASRSRWIRRYK